MTPLTATTFSTNGSVPLRPASMPATPLIRSDALENPIPGRRVGHFPGTGLSGAAFPPQAVSIETPTKTTRSR